MKAAGQLPEDVISPARQYRPDLDGMRAVAVLSVVAFHLYHSLLPGGFVGVDIFFVLSGFFITQLLLSDLKQSEFALFRFYDRRIRRLLPALFVMLALTTLAAAFILMPTEFRRFGRNMAGAALSISNFFFWTEDNYFSPDSETYPLLHTWSLAVEEQFYLLYPIALWGLWRFCRGWLPQAIGVVFGLSFALSAYVSYAAPAAAFYLAPSRAWELAGGALIAIGVFPAPRTWVTRQIAYGLGLAMVGASFLILNDEMVFPGTVALLPCAGTMLIIWAGLSMPHALVPRRIGFESLLGFRPLVWIGLISYSLYLWHWPLIVLSHQLNIDHPGLVTHFLLVPAMFALAYLSWRFVERPFRAAKVVWPTRRERFAYAGIALAALAVSGGGVVAANGLPGRMPPVTITLDESERDFSPIRAECHASGMRPRARRSWCGFGPSDGAPIYVYADSHGAEIGYALSEQADSLGLRVVPLTSSACPPVVGYHDHDRLNCRLNNEQTLARLEAAPKGTVILTTHFFRFADEVPGFWTGFEATVSRLEDAGHRVVILGPVPPDPDGTVPTILARMAYLGYPPDAYAFPVNTPKLDLIEARLATIAARTGTEFVRVAEYVCGARDQCAGLNEGTVIYFDDHHLSVTMARRLVDDRIVPLFAPPA